MVYRRLILGLFKFEKGTDFMKRYNIIMVYDQEMKRLLFCKRKKRPYIGKLNFPGGKWEEGEEYIEAGRDFEESIQAAKLLE